MAQAYHLLTLPNAHILSRDNLVNEFGSLNLQCVIPASSPTSNVPDIFLVVQLNAFEQAIDPTATVTLKIQPSNARTYIFQRTDVISREFALSLGPPPVSRPVLSAGTGSNGREAEEEYRNALQSFEELIREYADLRIESSQLGPSQQGHTRSPSAPLPPPHASQQYSSGITGGIGKDYANAQGDLRGKFILVNEDTKEVLGEFDNVNHPGESSVSGGHDRTLRVNEDPRLYETGHESDPVLIEVPEGAKDEDILKMFARAVPPEEQDWITRSATLVSKTITGTTNLLLSTVSAASSYYIAHSTPSPNHPGNVAARAAPMDKSPPNYNPPYAPASDGSGSPALPEANTSYTQRALSVFTSPTAQKGLTVAHTLSGHAVTVSHKTVSTVENMVRRAVGGKARDDRYKGKGGRILWNVDEQKARQKGEVAQDAMPPPYPEGTSSGYASPYPTPQAPNGSFPQANRAPSPLPPGVAAPPLPPRAPLTRAQRVLLSADLILGTIDRSLVQVFEVGGKEIGSVVGHKYGAEAQHASMMMTGTAKNAVLVYVDMAGIGRKALLRTAGKEIVRNQVSSKRK